MGYGFQTPPDVAAAMLALADREPATILEPCSGRGTLVAAAKAAFPRAEITSIELDEEYCREQAAAGLRVAQSDFFSLPTPSRKYDLVVANPPHSPMAVGYRMMDRLRDFADRMIVIMPWLWLINAQSRHERWRPHVRNAVHLPRSAFPGARIQTAIFDIDLLNRYGHTRLYGYADPAGGQSV